MLKRSFVSIMLVCLGAFGCQTEEISSKSPTLTLEKHIEVTPDETYSYGAFCRVNPFENSNDFFVTFGGSSPIATISLNEMEARAGGAEGGNGYSYKIYDENFDYTEENGIVSNSGGDAASVYAEGYYFFLAGAPEGWKLQKIDPSAWEVVDSITIEMDESHEARNDQMLAYANGQLIASSLYDPSNESKEMDQLNTDPSIGYGTHNRIFNMDLELLDYFILEDTPHINASYVVYEDGIYNYITSTALFGDLIVLQYDEDWNYIGVKTIAEHSNWSQGAVYDKETDSFYVTYIDFGELMNGKLLPGNAPNTIVGVYDKQWNLIEKIAVTSYTGDDLTHAGRPSVILSGNKLYVSYDVETFDETTREENKDWQCTVDIYRIQ